MIEQERERNDYDEGKKFAYSLLFADKFIKMHPNGEYPSSSSELLDSLAQFNKQVSEREEDPNFKLGVWDITRAVGDQVYQLALFGNYLQKALQDEESRSFEEKNNF